jgi:hypothetical protein
MKKMLIAALAASVFTQLAVSQIKTAKVTGGEATLIGFGVLTLTLKAYFPTIIEF